MKSGFLLLCIFLLLGAAIRVFFGSPDSLAFYYLIPLLICTVAVAVFFLPQRLHSGAAICFMGLALGFWRAESFNRASEYKNWYGQKVIIRAQVQNDPEISWGAPLGKTIYDGMTPGSATNGMTQGGARRINITQLVLRPESGYSQNIKATLFGHKKFNYGDKLLIKGTLREPKMREAGSRLGRDLGDGLIKGLASSVPNAGSEDRNYLEHLHSKNIYAELRPTETVVTEHSMANPIIYYSIKAKHFMFGKIAATLPPAPAGLLIALITGNRTYMDPKTISEFNLSGTAHMIAVSGYKLTLVIIALEHSTAYFSKKWVIAVSSLFSIFYATIAGFAPAVLRAVVMSFLYVLARFHGRKYSLLNALIFTAAVLVFLDPLILKYDLGFILSFGGILGIIFFSPLLKPLFERIPNYFGIKEIFISTVSAQLATTPIIILYFGRFSLIAPLANLLVVPLLAPCIILGYLCLLPVLGKLISWAIILPLIYILYVVGALSSLKIFIFSERISARAMLIMYIIEALAYFAFRIFLKRKNFPVKIGL